MNTQLKTLNKKLKTLHRRLDSRHNRLTHTLLLVVVLLAVTSPALAQSGVPIVDNILALIDEWKGAIVMLGVAFIAVGLLARKIWPESVMDNRTAMVSMVLGGILLTQLDTIATLIVGG